MNWHAQQSDVSGNGVNIIYHIPIATGNNRAGYSYRLALVASGIGGTTVMATGTTNGKILAAELAQIQAGEIFEYQEQFFTSPGEIATALRDRVDARYTALLSIIPAQLILRLTYWGFDRNVP